jgi:hypothetical protein
VDIDDIEALGSQKKATPLSQRKGKSGSSRGSTTILNFACRD